jgi:tetraacyldisaccharide 4'-kinase
MESELTSSQARQHRLRRPVISVGNLSLGGRGKTPVVALLARMLVEAGERPAVLTRGYGRQQPEDGVVVVSDGQHLLADVRRSGDEPMMLARDVPGACVLVCDQRAMAGALAERALGATVHILDDGFQHRQLARDVDVVIVSEGDLQDRRMPFGRLRESPQALERADAVIFDGDIPALGVRHSALAPITFHLTRALQEAVSLDPWRAWDAPDRRVVAVAGIAQPSRFFDALKAAGWIVAGTVEFGDHHNYSPADLARIAEVARSANAPVVTTAKDAIRLLPFRPFPVAIASVPLVVTIEPAAVFRDWLFERLRARVHA